MTRNFLQFQRSGRAVRIGEFSPRATALDWLRLQERSTGTKEGCAEGDCGACAVVVVRERDGRLFYEPLNSCITLLGQLDGAELITVEDLADDGVLHPVQAAMAREHGSQCGFCTPGIVMSLFAHYHECDGPTTRGKINDALAGYGFNPTEEHMDGDHVVEMQLGGPNELKNLWPLNAGVNRGSGATIAGMQLPLPTGKTMPMEDVKKEAAKRKVWLVIEKTEG